ncbi:hypothetical protein XENTR_v10002790 [Xenopus tropicalis]|nr:baculoviral IAP repeat-containing protein 1 isoform X1 [Xenopus tropicalis]XP_031749486.1 baculoviral IAP repeat-containing protein 1 isoform X1 [Xenopus tropicalis]KAE8635934.1 hypothetical protein XENTR_v10002790 [Xenopus tropicalis]
MASPEQSQDVNKDVGVMNIEELDASDFERRLSYLNIDFNQLTSEKNKEHAAIRQQLGSSYNFKMRSEARRLQSFLSYIKLSSWCPKQMAAAGFYFTGVELSVQCFCCGLVFCTSSLRTPPLEDHVKHNATCGFVQGKDVGNIPKYEIRVQQPDSSQRDLQEYEAEELRLKSFTGWPFYARIVPSELSSAGFLFTGTRDTVQCFSCMGCLGNWEENDDPWKEHAKWFPECMFLRSKKSFEDIKQYISTYNGFSGIMGKHFAAVTEDRTFPTITTYTSKNIFEDENVRLDSFKKWPENAHANPTSLAEAGFYYTGITDNVKCFTCGVCIHSFEPGDDLYTEHKKFSPACAFLHKLSHAKDEQIPNLSAQHLWKRRECHQIQDHGTPHVRWMYEAIKLQSQLVDVYCNAKFSKLLPFSDSSHVSLDLNSLFADISVTTKDTTNQRLAQLTLPDILSDLRDITMIEGEAGSGKTALLRKIAILWASGCCPMLSRFTLVFYISFPLIEKQQTLSNIICKQLIGPASSLTEDILGELMGQLKNQILFLVDNYGVLDFVPESIENLLLKNPWNRVSIAVTVRTDQGRKLRQHARSILSIQDFPLYSSVYICRQLFSHDMPRIEKFLLELISSKTFQAALKTPLFTLSLCVLWVQDPNEEMSSELSVCKAYLMHTILKHPNAREIVEDLVSACGELALMGLFQSKFYFTNEDLCAACVKTEDVLKAGLLSKFTWQRLQSTYSFFHASFQEFLAAKRMSDLLDSTDEVQKEKGFSYLQQINTFLKFAGRFYYFLNYCCLFSPKSATIIISHLFALLDNSEAFDCQSGTKVHLEHHPNLACLEQMLTVVNSRPTGFRLSLVTHMLLIFSIEAAYDGNSLAMCAPIILQFLKGKEITVHFSSTNKCFFTFLKDYPEGLSQIKSLRLSVVGEREEAPDLTLRCQEDLTSIWGIPTVEEDYSMAFQLATETQAQMKDYRRKNIAGFSHFDLNAGNHRINVLKVKTTGNIIKWEKALFNFRIFFPLSHHIELKVTDSPGFFERLGACIEIYKDSFVKCTLCRMELNSAEQELILHMTSLQSLKISGMLAPEHIIGHMDCFTQLKELTLDLSDECEVIGILPDGFKNLHSLEKLMFNNVSMETHSSRLAQFLTGFSNLTSFHLNCTVCPDFQKIMAAVSQNGKIQEIQLYGIVFPDHGIVSLASVLSLMTQLKVLNIERQLCDSMDTGQMFVQALPSLELLEELKLPSGSAIKEMAIPIILQLQYLPNLRVIHFTNDTLNDSSLLELANASRAGHLRNIQSLNLSANHDITQSGWRSFFQTLDNLLIINELNIYRIYTYQHKTDPLTLKALVQCVSRLHSLTCLVMHGWLLDEKDLEMFNTMKENHPKAKSFMLLWQWSLPFGPTVKK